MRHTAFLVLLATLAAALWAEDPAPRAGPAPLKPPKGVTLTPEQEKLLAEANVAVERGYALLVEKHEPGQAVDELRKALAIMNHIVALKGDEQQLAGVAPGNEKGTPFDKIKMSGEIEKIVEIAAAMGVSAPDEVDNGLHKRKIVEDAKESVKKIDAEQKKITQQLQTMGGGGGEPPKDQPQQQQNDQAGQPQAAAADQNQAAQPSAGQAAPQQPAADGQQAQPQGAQDLAAKQDAVARELNKLATKMGEIGRDNAGQQNQASQAFRKAGAEASKTAEMIRQGETQAATAASKQVERAIQNALHEAGLAGEGALEAAVSAIEKQLGKMQADQQALLNKAQEIAKGADGRQAAERTQQERAAALAIEQGKLKPQVEDVQRAIEDLARTAGGANPAARTPENAARAELSTAAAELQKGRPKQAVVNAAMKLAQGDTPAATKAMSQVQNALDAAQQRVTAADNALASGDVSRLESAHRAVQQLAASARRLENTARTAAGQPEPKGGQPQEKATGKAGEDKQAQTGQDTKTGAPAQHAEDKTGDSPQPSAAGQPQTRTEDSSGAVSGSWGQVLNKAAEQVTGETGRMARRLSTIAPEAGQQLNQVAKTQTSFERDFPGSLQQVHKLLLALEKVEQELGAKVAKEKEGKALRNYRKEDIPRGYREAVAAYYEELSKEEKK